MNGDVSLPTGLRNDTSALRGRSCVATHADVCFGRRRRLPIATATV